MHEAQSQDSSSSPSPPSLVLPFALPSTAAAETLAQKTRPRARDHGPAHHARRQHGAGRRALRRRHRQARRASQPHIAANEHTLAVTRYDLQLAKAMLQQRVVAMYKQRPVEHARRDRRHQELLVDGRPALHAAPRELRASRPWSTRSAAIQTTIKAAQKSLATEQAAAQKLVAQRATEKAGVESALAARQSLLRGVKAQIAALEAQQAARRPPERPRSSGGYVAHGGRRSTPTTAAWWPSPRASSARCPTCGAAPRRRASTAPASPCTAGPPSA